MISFNQELSFLAILCSLDYMSILLVEWFKSQTTSVLALRYLINKVIWILLFFVVISHELVSTFLWVDSLSFEHKGNFVLSITRYVIMIWLCMYLFEVSYFYASKFYDHDVTCMILVPPWSEIWYIVYRKHHDYVC